MAYEDELERALEVAKIKGTISEDDRESVSEFEERFADLFDTFDYIPNASEIPPEEWDDYINFFDDYDLWDEFRDDWERYEKVA